MGGMRNAHKISLDISEGGDKLGNLHIGGKIILKWIL
jgi:hypothetical protein